jgi:hypothetical protein
MHIPTPKLYFRKTCLENGVSFEEPFTDKNCKNWSSTALNQLSTLAQHRIQYLNGCMPDRWVYEIVGWRIDL